MYLFYMVSRVVKVLPIQEFTTKTPTYPLGTPQSVDVCAKMQWRVHLGP